MKRWEDENNESVYERCGKCSGVWCNGISESKYFEVVWSY